MTSSTDFFKDLQQRQVEAMEAFQSAVSDSMRAWQEALGAMAPSASGDASGSASPTFGQLPTPAQLADAYFSFAEQVLSRQHEFAVKLIEAVTPPPQS